MKKITSEKAFDFQYDGSTKLHISPSGCLATEKQAKVVKMRFPSVIVEDVEIKEEIKKEIKATTRKKSTPKSK